MVSTTYEADRSCRVVIRPNRSLTWRQVQLVFLAVVAVWSVVGLGFALRGFWPVLPFAGAEVLALGAALYVCALRGHASQTVSVRTATVEVEKGEVEKGRRTGEQRWNFPRPWTRVTLLRPRVGWYPSRLLIGAHGRRVELADFLNEEERRHLAGYLRAKIAEVTGPEGAA